MNAFEQVKGGLIVSCQALADEPMFGSEVMAKFALAAKQGGAKGIRANTIPDIRAIKKTVDLPVIGIIKKDYPDSEVYITPTFEEVKALIDEGVDVIALDGTRRSRPAGETLEGLVEKIRAYRKDVLLMADTSTYEEAVYAEKLGFDFAGTTLVSYTPYTKGEPIPALPLRPVHPGHCGGRYFHAGGAAGRAGCRGICSGGRRRYYPAEADHRTLCGRIRKINRAPGLPKKEERALSMCRTRIFSKAGRGATKRL